MVRILNETRRSIVAENAKEVRGILGRMRGLMLKKSPECVILVAPSSSISASSIHMFFMLQRIDVIWADDELRVVDLLSNLKPWSLRIFRPSKPARYVIECPSGTIERTKTKRGDRLSFNKPQRRNLEHIYSEIG